MASLCELLVKEMLLATWISKNHVAQHKRNRTRAGSLPPTHQMCCKTLPHAQAISVLLCFVRWSVPVTAHPVAMPERWKLSRRLA